MNSMVQLHDNFCDCSGPLQHIIILIFQQEPEIKFKPIEQDIIKRCLSGDTAAAGATGQEEDGLEPGLLEDLFKEDIGEEDAAR